jgi:hypothetical protein
MKPIFTNARKIAVLNDETFKRDISDLAVGTFAKICHENIEQPERFWIKVMTIEGDIVTGEVFNNMFYSTLEHGDILTIHVDNIYAIHTGEAGHGDESDNMRSVCGSCNE